VSVRFLRGNRASHDPLAARALQARVAWRHRPLPTSLRTGKKAVPATRGARSNRGWGEVSAVSNHGGECRGSVFSTPDPVHLRRLPDRKATFDRTRQSSPLLPSGAGCSSGPSRARGNIHLQKSERRTRPGRRSRTANGQRSSRGFRTSMNTCGSCRRRPAATAAPRGPSKGSARRSSPVEGTSSSGRSDALTCSGGNGLTRQGHWGAQAPQYSVGHERCQRARIGKASARRQSGGAFTPPHPQGLVPRGRAWWPVDPKPALRRQARSRWRPDDRKMVRRRLRNPHR
jgi:hypothetical protein